MRSTFWLLAALLLVAASISARAQSPPLTQCVSSAIGGGTADAITIPKLPCVPTTTLLVLVPTLSNVTTTPTIKAEGGQPEAVVRFDGSPVAAGDLLKGARLVLVNNGKNWFLINPGLPNVAGPSEIIDPRNGYGMACGATVDATAALQAADNHLKANHGGMILVPCPIAIGGTLTLDDSVQLVGIGPAYYRGMLGESLTGGVVAATWPPTSGPAINCTNQSTPCVLVKGIGTAIRNINFGNPQATPPFACPGSGPCNNWNPTIYPFVISTSAAANWNGLYIDHVSFTAASNCIDLEGTPNYDTSGIAGAQWTIEDVWFNGCFNDEIKLHNIDNTGRIHNIDADFWWNRGYAPVGYYVKHNRVGLDLQYAANTEISNYEFFAEKYAVLFTNSTVITGGFPKTFSAFNVQFSQIGFNLPCQAMGIGSSGNATLVNGELNGMIASADGTGQCPSQNAFFDLSSDNVNFTFGGPGRIGSVDTLAAIGGSSANPSGILYLDALDVGAYSAFHAGQPFIKASAHASVSFGTTNKSAIRPASGAGKLIGLGVDGSGPASEQPTCVGGSAVESEGAVCLQGSLGAPNSGGVILYSSGVLQGIVGAANSSGLNVKSTTGPVLLESTNGGGGATASFGTNSSNQNIINLTPLPTAPPSGVGGASVCVDNVGNLYVKLTCP